MLRGAGRLVALLDAAERLKPGSKKQREALHAIWVQLTPAQRRQMVASDSDDDDDDDDSDDDSGGAGGGGSSGGGGGGARSKPTQGPPAAKRACAKGHGLDAVWCATANQIEHTVQGAYILGQGLDLLFAVLSRAITRICRAAKATATCAALTSSAGHAT